MERTEVKVVTLPVKQWMEQYYRPDEFIESCKACPNYGQVWSCPPLAQPTQELVSPFSRIHLICVKVIYSEQTRAAAMDKNKINDIRAATYGKAKRIMLESLLELEKAIPGSWCIAAGECELCKACNRRKGVPCRMPNRMRYSFSGLGFDLTRIAKELFDVQLLWQPEGLPEYNVAMAALLDRQGKRLEQKYNVESGKPWQLFQEEVLGVLRQIGCEVRWTENGTERIVLTDTATGEDYRLSFCEGERCTHGVELENQTGSGRRMMQLSDCLQSRFPELVPKK